MGKVLEDILSLQFVFLPEAISALYKHVRKKPLHRNDFLFHPVQTIQQNEESPTIHSNIDVLWYSTANVTL